ncbi:aliphatic sulfonate ABC transporter substrate-binding protein [Anabaena cylindrica FACHB-243]|uniref:Putative aliphatic sulfonates-binding protein n=1 Tax=Anabaena cylindrica (strain ATCC 27899 / PCC 7122) TaxID=272123 RepID=K9ZDY8_ANACC|nr:MULTISPECIES: aliphatic sulfonate ABC transporter substrate-binding protein [Anabaena]AFZ56797.1 aliphatic sulfonates family ABC transporter, periplasmic ligand-binding protein [Anabaena cylindrica PCC 7122]MBD2418592.1 aliphatic sulfonate ABC transporter substrate-binding protein [Anabaena cylindrica FACHB-243]MBY5283604.1 aliphatic sulfonate ABC transporter substrate-binding protein [Anabaena sp. CCAP 1446/1C]MBY5311296.1 aliphatic sulfonate ABC transporter substrate-binding protein [Anaba
MEDWQNKFESWKVRRINRRNTLFFLGHSLVLSILLFSCSNSPNNTQKQANSSTDNTATTTAASDSNTKKVVRIVRSKQLTALAVLEQKGTLTKRLESLGYKVEWPEFAAGPQQLEALNAGGLDIASTAESPPVFSQAAGSPLVYLAANSSDGQAISLLVPVNSPVKNFQDLKGKKIAFQKASIGHYLTVRAVEKAGMKLGDVESVFLAPPDANVAFSQKKVDAWFIWEPFVTRNVQNKAGRVLIDGSGGLRDTNNFYTTNRKFYQENPEVIKVFLEELQNSQVWAKNHPKEIAQLLTSATQLDVPTLEKMHSKYDFALVPINEEVINKQQEVADKWLSLGLIPKRVNVRDGFLTPEQYAEITPKEVLAQK